MKYIVLDFGQLDTASPPAWGAWIEIVSVWPTEATTSCRPPHGGRGLKCFEPFINGVINKSPPAWGAWIEI